MDNYFAINLKYLREKRNMSITELANKLKVNPSTLSRWENEIMGATITNAKDVADFFGVPITDLLTKQLQLERYQEKDELDDLFDSCREHLTENDIELMKTIMRQRMKEIDKELDEGDDN